MKAMLLSCIAMLGTLLSYSQEQQAVVHLEIRGEQHAVHGAVVLVDRQSYETDQHGKASFRVSIGQIDIAITAAGYAPQTVSLTLAAGEERTVLIKLEKVQEEVIVTATRTDRRIEDQPTRVEVLNREEVEEKMLMTPGDIVMMLNEMGGLRVQTTSPSLGAASVRIQGMRGRYTRFLSDGLPLFGQQVGGLGLLQIPPMDLGQVEVIKGTTSALYGAGAMGGVVNLVSRRPTKQRFGDFLINQSTRGATDGVAFVASPLKANWSTSMLASANYQRETDVDDDRWADLPGYRRGVMRPRLFWEDREGNTLFLTGGFTYEDRTGGTVDEEVLPQTGLPYRESLESRNYDVGAVAQRLIAKKYLLSARFAAGRRSHRHVFGEIVEHDTHDTLFSELTLRRTLGKHTLVGGVAFDQDLYDPRDVPRFYYRYLDTGTFIQDDFDVKSWLSVSAGARVDIHNVYGTFLSPRISALFRVNNWSSRVSWGRGFFAPTPSTEETEAAGLTRLTIPEPLKAERGQSVSVDVTRAAGIASYTVTLFGSKVANPSEVDRSTYSLLTLLRPTYTAGVEGLATLKAQNFAVTASYTYVQAREFETGQRVDVPLTPRHNAGIVAMWEAEGKGRIGVELYYTGQQRLEANPYRTESRPYFIVGFLAERRFGRVRAFINAENLTGTRQTKWDPLLLPARAVDGRWTVDSWAPLEGRTFNGGIRVSF